MAASKRLVSPKISFESDPTCTSNTPKALSPEFSQSRMLANKIAEAQTSEVSVFFTVLLMWNLLHVSGASILQRFRLSSTGQLQQSSKSGILPAKQSWLRSPASEPICEYECRIELGQDVGTDTCIESIVNCIARRTYFSCKSQNCFVLAYFEHRSIWIT